MTAVEVVPSAGRLTDVIVGGGVSGRSNESRYCASSPAPESRDVGVVRAVAATGIVYESVPCPAVEVATAVPSDLTIASTSESGLVDGCTRPA